MKIVLDGSLLGARFSGVERSIGELVRHLPAVARDDDRFELFVGSHFDRYVERFLPGGLGDDPRLEVVRCDLDNKQQTSRIWWQQVVLPRLIQGAEAQVFHGPGYLVPRLCPIPAVVTLYDLFALDQPRFCTFANRLHYRWALPAGVARCRRVIVPSAATRRAVARRLPEAYERTVVVPLGVGERFHQAGDDETSLRERRGLPDDYLLWVGNVEPKKNTPLLLKAVEELRRRGVACPKLVIVGDWSWGSDQLKRTWIATGMESHVYFLGQVRDEELPALYRGARAFLFPSLAEGFGLPPLEAMAAGVPTLVSDAGSLPEVVGEAGLVLPADDAAAWADGIARVLSDEALGDRLRARGRSRALEFTWRRTARETLRIYREVAGVEHEESHEVGLAAD